MSSAITDSDSLRDFIINHQGIVELWDEMTQKPEQKDLLKNLITEAVKACQKGDNEKFDAHTRANWCHGIALLVNKIIFLLQKMDLTILEKILNQDGKVSCIPVSILYLAGLFALNNIAEIQNGRGRLTKAKRLKAFGSVGSDYCDKLVKNLQVFFSNLVVEKYEPIFSDLDHDLTICGVPASFFAKYTQKKLFKEGSERTSVCIKFIFYDDDYCISSNKRRIYSYSKLSI